MIDTILKIEKDHVYVRTSGRARKFTPVADFVAPQPVNEYETTALNMEIGDSVLLPFSDYQKLTKALEKMNRAAACKSISVFLKDEGFYRYLGMRVWRVG